MNRLQQDSCIFMRRRLERTTMNQAKDNFDLLTLGLFRVALRIRTVVIDQDTVIGEEYSQLFVMEFLTKLV